MMFCDMLNQAHVALGSLSGCVKMYDIWVEITKLH